MIPNQPSREVFSTRSNRICVDEEKRPAVAWTRRSPVTGTRISRQSVGGHRVRGPAKQTLPDTPGFLSRFGVFGDLIEQFFLFP
jgi:hypothetical protein